MNLCYSSFLLAVGLCPLVWAQSSPNSVSAAANRQKLQQEADKANEKDSADLLVPNQEAAKEIGERIYNTWRLSMIRGNKTAWSSVTARSRQFKVRNLVVSERGNFERDFFRNEPQEPPMLENFRFVGALAACKGSTLALTYYGRLQLGENSEAEPCAFVLHFIQEGSEWKFDQSSFFSLKALPAVAKRLGDKDVSVLKQQDGFYPYAKIPKVPALCPSPQLIGKLFVDCPGREAQVKINGISQHEFYSERRADVISGGLRRGNNTISYSFKDAEQDDKIALAIGLFVIPETEGNSPATVFEYILDGSDKAQDGSFTFTISNDSIAAMNPEFKGKKPEPFRPVPLKAKPKGTSSN